MKSHIFLFQLLLIITVSCNKSDFLSAKPRSSMVVPHTLQDFQALLDNSNIMNVTPAIGEASSDNYYMSYNLWQAMSLRDKAIYIWDEDTHQGSGNINDWTIPYQQIFTANQVLNGIDKIPETAENSDQRNSIKGAAHFFRAYAFYHLTQVFCPPYDEDIANTPQLGLPLKLDSDVNTIESRATLQQTYDQIFSDLSIAEGLLPPMFNFQFRNRPSLVATHALYARIYMSMRNYARAEASAQKGLEIYDSLIDFNTLPISTKYYFPFTALNSETIFQSIAVNINSTQLLIYLGGITDQISIDTVLYDLYDSNDLRKYIYYTVYPNKAINPNGTYYPDRSPFTGLATDELYLIRAECFARSGKPAEALDVLNKLLRKRYKSDKFSDITAPDSEVLSIILQERRKELVFRGRWSDIRRLNQENAEIILQRELNGTIHTLQPNSPRYVLPIPPDEIALSSIHQNQR